ncbi:MAG: hypothetical protein ACRECQ_00055 [Burkholderiaceae bacterium]
MPDYANAKIYIMSGGGDSYIGSTCEPLIVRFAKHVRKARKSPNMKVYSRFNELGWQNVTIELLHAHPCNSSREHRLEEQRSIDVLRPTLNTRRAHRTKEQRAEQNAKSARAKVPCSLCGACVSRDYLARHVKNMHPA